MLPTFSTRYSKLVSWETSVREDIEWYHALVRAMLEGDRPGLVRRAFLTFDADPMIRQPQLVLRASKGTTQDILLQDLTSAWSSFRPPAPDQRWFDVFKSSSPPLHALSKRVLLNDLSTLDTPKWARGDSYVINSSGVQWGETPFLECVDGRFLPGWLLSLSMPFYGLKPDLNPEFRWVHFLAEMVSNVCVSLKIFLSVNSLEGIICLKMDIQFTLITWIFVHTMKRNSSIFYRQTWSSFVFNWRRKVIRFGTLQQNVHFWVNYLINCITSFKSSIIIVSLFWWCRGVIRVDVNIQGFNVDQCASGDFWFANTHQCNRTSMEVSVLYTEHKWNHFIKHLLQAPWASRVIKMNQHFIKRLLLNII